MSNIPQKADDGNSVFDFATKFMKRFHLGRLLFKCNAGKEKGIPVMDIFRYLFCMMFSDRSVYMQMKAGTFEEAFSKNSKMFRRRDIQGVPEIPVQGDPHAFFAC